MKAMGLLTGLALVVVGAMVGCGSDKDDGAANGDGAGGNTILDPNDGGEGAGPTKKRECNPQPGCNDLQVEFESVVPTVMILVDRSSSMFDTPFGNSPNRWQPLKEALIGENGVLRELHGAVRFGFATYTHQQVNGAAACPLMDVIDIATATDSFDSIVNLYDEVSVDPATTGSNPLTYKGETPTGAAIRAVLPVLEADQAPGPKFLLLVTDGEPDTCAEPDPQCGQDEAIAAVQEAFAKNIRTFVIGVGEIGRDHLQDLANAGAGQPVQRRTPQADCDPPTLGSYEPSGGDARYYRPENPADLRDDIGRIVGGVRSCEFKLSEEVDLEKADKGTVLLDCEGLPYDDANGWRMTSPTDLELVGDACATIKTTIRPDLYITFPCESYVVVR